MFSDIVKLINDIGYFNNVKVKIIIDIIKIVVVLSFSFVMNITVSVVIRIIFTVIVVGLSGVSIIKVVSLISIKFIVFISINSGNIIKIIVIAGLFVVGIG